MNWTVESVTVASAVEAAESILKPAFFTVPSAIVVLMSLRVEFAPAPRTRTKVRACLCLKNSFTA